MKRRIGTIKIGDQVNYWKAIDIQKIDNRTTITWLCTGCSITIKKESQTILQDASKSCGCMKSTLRVQTNLEKYGTESPLQNKEIKEKVKRTSTERYGENYNQEYAKRRASTIKERYGVQAFTQTEIFKDKAKKTNLEKYNTINPSKQFREKAKQTNIKKYGAPTFAQSDMGRAFMEQRPTTLKLSDGRLFIDICREYQVKTSWAGKVFREYGEEAFVEYCKNGPKTYLSTEKVFIDILNEDFPQLEKYDCEPIEFKINRRPDFRLEKDNKVLYINTDGLFVHSTGYGKRALSKDYHFKLNKDFKDNKQTIYQFREDELRSSPDVVRSIILNYFGISSTIPARKCTFKPVESKVANQFFQDNHLMGPHKASSSYGLYYQDQLVCCISIRQTNSETIEIARFCSKVNLSIVGGLGKLLCKIKTFYNFTQIISWCDLRYGDGHGYIKVGFELEKIVQGWSWTDGTNTYNRLRCRANMDDRKLTQRQHADELGWHKIYDAGQAKYVLKVNNKK
jgi:hypothetical protein